MQVLASVRNWEVPRLFSPLNFRTVRTTAHGAPVYRRSIDPVCASGFRTAGALSLSFDSTKAFRPHRSGKHVVHFQDKDGREQQALARQDRPAEAAEERYTHSGPLVMAWDDSQHTHRAVEWVVKNFASTGDRLVLLHVVHDAHGILSTSQHVGSLLQGSSDVVLPDDPSIHQSGAELEAYRDQLTKNAECRMKEAIQIIRNAGMEHEVMLPFFYGCQAAASIGEELLSAVQERQGRLLIVATHGHASACVVGSVTHHLLRHSTAPILLVPPPRHSQGMSSASARAPALAPNLREPSDPYSVDSALILAAPVSTKGTKQIQPAIIESREGDSGTANQTPGQSQSGDSGDEDGMQHYWQALAEAVCGVGFGLGQIAQPEEDESLPGSFGTSAAPTADTQTSPMHAGNEEVTLAGKSKGLQARASAEGVGSGVGDSPLPFAGGGVDIEQLPSGLEEPGLAKMLVADQERLGAPEEQNVEKRANDLVLVVVHNLQDLEDRWRWVAGNLAQKGDTMDIWHLSGPSNSGLPSAGTSLSTRIKADGHFSNVMTDVLYTDYGDAADVGLQVCEAAANPRVKVVVLFSALANSSIHSQMMQQGDLVSHLVKHCVKPLLLLPASTSFQAS